MLRLRNFRSYNFGKVIALDHQVIGFDEFGFDALDIDLGNVCMN